nr:hypothetical protein [Propionicimonas sp.]
MRRFLLAAALTATFAVGAAAATPTAAAPLPQAATCTGVWVVVDFGSLGGTSTKCATSFDTGTKALKSAGFSVTIDDGFVYKIAGKPSKPDINKAYWSYWHATKQDDGSYSDWSYSNVGANGYHPTRGNAEGWRYQSLSEGKVPPAARPPKADTASPTPKPTATKPKPTAKPSAKPTPKPTATKSATTSPSASATASVSASATASPSATASASATPTPSATPSVDATPTDVVTPSAEEATATAEPAPDAGGSPVGAIAAGVVVVAAGAGLGGWWWLKGRKP